MGFHIKYDDLDQFGQYSSNKVSTWKEELDTLYQSLEGYVGTEEFEGAWAQSSKNYFEEVHYKIITSIKEVIEEFDSRFLLYNNGYYSEIDAQCSSVLHQDTLDEVKVYFNNSKTRYEGYEKELELQLNNISDILFLPKPTSSLIYDDYHTKDTETTQLIERVGTYESNHENNDFTNLDSMLSPLKTLINEYKNKAGDTSVTYVSNSVLSSQAYKELSEAVTVASEDRNGLLSAINDARIQDQGRQRSAKEGFPIEFGSLKLKTDFPLIDGKAYGGDQEWFDLEMWKYGGCGPTAASNQLVHLALKDPRSASKVGINLDNILTEDEYKLFMDKIYSEITPINLLALDYINKKIGGKDSYGPLPPTIGLWPVSNYTSQMNNFISNYNLDVNVKSISNGFAQVTPIPMIGSTQYQHIKYTEGINFIQNGIKSNSPVALLNMLNKTPMYQNGDAEQSTEQHWVTITGIEYNSDKDDYQLTVSSWGEEYSISYNELYDSWKDPRATGAGMVYITEE